MYLTNLNTISLRKGSIAMAFVRDIPGNELYRMETILMLLLLILLFYIGTVSRYALHMILKSTKHDSIRFYSFVPSPVFFFWGLFTISSILFAAINILGSITSLRSMYNMDWYRNEREKDGQKYYLQSIILMLHGILKYFIWIKSKCLATIVRPLCATVARSLSGEPFTSKNWGWHARIVAYIFQFESSSVYFSYFSRPLWANDRSSDTIYPLQYVATWASWYSRKEDLLTEQKQHYEYDFICVVPLYVPCKGNTWNGTHGFGMWINANIEADENDIDNNSSSRHRHRRRCRKQATINLARTRPSTTTNRTNFQRLILW